MAQSSSPWPTFRPAEPSSSSAPSSGPSSSPAALSGVALLQSLKRMPPKPTNSSRSSHSTSTGWTRNESLIAIVGEPVYPDEATSARLLSQAEDRFLARIRDKHVHEGVAKLKSGALPSPIARPPTLIHIAPDRKKPMCGVRGGRAAEAPEKAILTTDVWCSRCLTKWEREHGPAKMLNGIPARSRMRTA